MRSVVDCFSQKRYTETHMAVTKTLLLILDGFGLANPKNPGNAITPETAPNIFGYMKTYASTQLTAHGAAVGLFPNQEGNSEAGHFNIGAGRLVKQDLLHISDAIADGTFFKNTAFDEAVFHAKKYNTAVHVVGLLTDGQSAHAHPEHLYALLEYLQKVGQKKVYLHLFTDGRDSQPHSAIHHLRELRAHMNNGEKIATMMGRFYGMDRNKIWERTEAAYNTMVLAKGSAQADCAENAIAQAYNRGETDEYISPTVIMEAGTLRHPTLGLSSGRRQGKPVATIQDNDVIFFFNARSDRARQITKAFVQPDFQKKNPGAFKRKRVPKHIRFVAMTDFGPDLPSVLTAFPSPDIENALAKAIGERYRQLYISETEKYAHVTYFINGGHASAINGEVRELISSGAVNSYAEKPGMHAKELTDRILTYLKKDQYDFICVNYPNADMVGHTGDYHAAKQAVQILDREVARLVEDVLKRGGQALLVADHGNAEEMINEKTGEMWTEHTDNPVPCIMIRVGKKVRMEKGALTDVAPTLLKMMEIEKPKQMTGKSLF